MQHYLGFHIVSYSLVDNLWSFCPSVLHWLLCLCCSAKMISAQPPFALLLCWQVGLIDPQRACAFWLLTKLPRPYTKTLYWATKPFYITSGSSVRVFAFLEFLTVVGIFWAGVSSYPFDNRQWAVGCTVVLLVAADSAYVG